MGVAIRSLFERYIVLGIPRTNDQTTSYFGSITVDFKSYVQKVNCKRHFYTE